MALLEVQGGTKRFGGLTAVNDVHFAVAPGEILSVIGPNGAGKSTLFKLISSFLRPTSGRIRFEAEDITNLKPHIVARKGIVRTFQETTVFKEMTALENVVVGHHLQSRAGLAGFFFNTRTAREDNRRFRRSAAEISTTSVSAMSSHVKEEKARNLPHGHLRALGIATVPEGRRVFPFMSVKDHLLMGAFTRTDAGEVTAKLDYVLARFPRLEERWRQDAGTLSGGEQQMLVIGRALMSDPKLLLLDEPSLGIAPKLVQDIARSIVAIDRENRISVILVEQNARMALRVSHRAYVLSQGRVALHGPSAELRDDDRIRALYLGGEL